MGASGTDQEREQQRREQAEAEDVAFAKQLREYDEEQRWQQRGARQRRAERLVHLAKAIGHCVSDYETPDGLPQWVKDAQVALRELSEETDHE